MNFPSIPLLLGAPGAVGGAVLADVKTVLGTAVAVTVTTSIEVASIGMRTPPGRHSEQAEPVRFRGAKPGK